jgi:hypothetical protein
MWSSPTLAFISTPGIPLFNPFIFIFVLFILVIILFLHFNLGLGSFSVQDISDYVSRDDEEVRAD